MYNQNKRVFSKTDEIAPQKKLQNYTRVYPQFPRYSGLNMYTTTTNKRGVTTKRNTTYNDEGYMLLDQYFDPKGNETRKSIVEFDTKGRPELNENSANIIICLTPLHENWIRKGWKSQR